MRIVPNSFKASRTFSDGSGSGGEQDFRRKRWSKEEFEEWKRMGGERRGLKEKEEREEGDANGEGGGRRGVGRTHLPTDLI